MSTQSLAIQPIGFFSGPDQYAQQAPRQGIYTPSSRQERIGRVIMNPGQNFEQALQDLDGFERIWLQFGFHLAQDGFKPMVRPPVGDGKKVGVFATRSPHRPNRLGLSCVRLVGLKGLELQVQDFDLLDGTPIYDIKPYVPLYDSHPQSRAGWVAERTKPPGYALTRTPRAAARLAYLMDAGLDLFAFCELQLGSEPTDSARKRVSRLRAAPDLWELAFRTWRITFTIDESARLITLHSIRSGYTKEELEAGAPDPYADKDLHRRFELYGFAD